MQITLAMICEKLNENYKTLYPPNVHKYISTACILYGDDIEYNSSVLYITSSKFLTDNFHSKLPDVLLCVGNISSDIFLECANKSTFIQLNSVNNCNDILNCIINIILSYQNWANRFLSAVIEHKGCHTYIELIHEIIPNPMWIVDSNNCLLTYTANDPCEGNAGIPWNKTIENGYISLIGATADDISYVNKQLIGNPEPSLIYLNAVSIPFLGTNINVDNRRAALISIMAYHRSITQSDIDICKWIQEILVIEFRYTKMINNYKDIQYETLLIELIEGQITSEYYLQSRTANLTWQARKYNFLILIPCQNISLSAKSLQKLNSHPPSG